MQIRIAVLGDLPELLDIYNYEVLNGYATFDSIPQTYEQRKVWFEEHNKDHHPLIVAVDDEGKIAGYSSLSSYRPKDSYKPSVELSVYVSPNHRRMGVATVLMEHILEMAREDDTIHTVVSVITSGNDASIRLHEKFGFTYCGTIREVGIKFGKLMSIDNFQLIV